MNAAFFFYNKVTLLCINIKYSFVNRCEVGHGSSQVMGLGIKSPVTVSLLECLWYVFS